MGFLSKLFGGGESKTETSVQSFSPYTEAQQEIINKLAKGYSNVGEPAPSYPGQLSVPTTGQEQQYFDFVNGLSGNKAVQQALKGEVPYETGTDYASTYFEENVRPEMKREWDEIVFPQLRESYAGTGYWGTPRAKAEVKSATDLAQRLSEAKAELMYKEEQADRAAKDTALSRATEFNPVVGQMYGQAGELARNIEQEKLVGDLQRWLMGEEVDGKHIQEYTPEFAGALAILGIQPYQPVTSTTSTTTGPGLGYQMLSSFAGATGKALGTKVGSYDFGSIFGD